ncbi:MAG: ImmA/IrrE family metallo-endopeptidase, partial [Spirochaetales bacterium]|nr:ImmA/IrrE family metallo-endopeptidase [Spirochaetales bacterium]
INASNNLRTLDTTNKSEVDITEIIKKKSINIFEVDFPNNVSGALDMRNPNNPIIYLNKDHHLHRKRFTLAHELGHFILHHGAFLHLDKNLYFRDNFQNKNNDLIEIETNEFAANILMPYELIKSDIINKKDSIDDEEFIIQMAEKYNVSQIAMTIRIKKIFEE